MEYKYNPPYIKGIVLGSIGFVVNVQADAREKDWCWWKGQTFSIHDEKLVT